MKLSEKQAIFTSNIARLIAFAWSKGYRLTFGEAWRPPEMAKLNAKSGKGIANSLHTVRLAVDFNLYKDGVYMTKTEDHEELGAFWKSLDPLNRWGGDFRSRPDGNHYSMEHNGIQ
jgi:hypothetical protein